jgi:hypothetical protein
MQEIMLARIVRFLNGDLAADFRAFSPYSTVTDFADAGLVGVFAMMTAVWYASIWMGIA